MSQLRINGKPATLWQKILMAGIGIVSLIFTFTFGAVILLFLLIAGSIGALVFWWRTRQIRKILKAQMDEAQAAQTKFYDEMRQASQSSPKDGENDRRGNLYEGEYKEL